MPRYEFLCQKCRKPFELIMTISEREKAKVKCPKCKSTKVVPQTPQPLAEQCLDRFRRVLMKCLATLD